MEWMNGWLSWVVGSLRAPSVLIKLESRVTNALVLLALLELAVIFVSLVLLVPQIVPQKYLTN